MSTPGHERTANTRRRQREGLEILKVEVNSKILDSLTKEELNKVASIMANDWLEEYIYSYWEEKYQEEVQLEQILKFIRFRTFIEEWLNILRGPEIYYTSVGELFDKNKTDIYIEYNCSMRQHKYVATFANELYQKIYQQ